MVLQDWVIANPRISIIVISFVVTLLLTLVRYYMTDREKMKDLRERQKALREEMKQYRSDPDKMMELNKRMLEDMPEQMKMQFKPMVITMIPILLVLGWMRSTYALTAIADTWLWWYIGASLVFGITMSKWFGLQ